MNVDGGYRNMLFVLLLAHLLLNSADSCRRSTSSGKKNGDSEDEQNTMIKTFTTHLSKALARAGLTAGNWTWLSEEDQTDFIRCMNCSCHLGLTGCSGDCSSSSVNTTLLHAQSGTAAWKYNCSRAASNTWMVCDERDAYVVSNKGQCGEERVNSTQCSVPTFGAFVMNSTSYFEVLTSNETITLQACEGELTFDKDSLQETEDEDGTTDKFTLIFILSVSSAFVAVLIILISVVVCRDRKKTSARSNKQNKAGDAVRHSNFDSSTEHSNTRLGASGSINCPKHPTTDCSSSYDLAGHRQTWAPTAPLYTECMEGKSHADSPTENNDTYANVGQIPSQLTQTQGLLVEEDYAAGNENRPTDRGFKNTSHPTMHTNNQENGPGTSPDHVDVDMLDNEATIVFPAPGEYARLGEHVRRPPKDVYEQWPLAV